MTNIQNEWAVPVETAVICVWYCDGDSYSEAFEAPIANILSMDCADNSVHYEVPYNEDYPAFLAWAKGCDEIVEIEVCN